VTRRDDAVVRGAVDGSLITGQDPPSSKQIARTLLDAMRKQGAY